MVLGNVNDTANVLVRYPRTWHIWDKITGSQLSGSDKNTNHKTCILSVLTSYTNTYTQWQQFQKVVIENLVIACDIYIKGILNCAIVELFKLKYVLYYAVKYCSVQQYTVQLMLCQPKWSLHSYLCLPDLTVPNISHQIWVGQTLDTFSIQLYVCLQRCIELPLHVYERSCLIWWNKIRQVSVYLLCMT